MISQYKSQIKLDSTDRKILFELDKNCRISTSRIAKNLKLSREIVKYRIKNLKRKRIIDNFITIIDPTKLGYQMYKIHLQLASLEDERERFYRYVKQMPNIYWVGFCDGAWDVILTLFARDSMHLHEINKEFLGEFKNLIVKQSLGNFVHAHFLSKGFLNGSSNYINNTQSIGNKVIHNKIDNIDKKLIYALSNNARLPITELSKKTNCKPGLIRSRLKSMETKGIIVAYKIDLFLKLLRLETYKAFIYYNHMEAKREKALLEYVSQNPKASLFLRVIGSWGGEIEFIVENHREFNDITNDFRKKFSDIIKGYESVLINEEFWTPGIRLD